MADNAILAPVCAPLSLVQRQIWTQDRLGSGITNLCQTAAIRLTGRLDPAWLEAGLRAILHRHDTLRTIFPIVDGQPRQVVVPVSEWLLPVTELDTAPAADGDIAVREFVRRESVTPFDLERGPLLRANLLRLNQTEHVLVLTLHDIVGDEWSQGVLLDELETLYAAQATGQANPLPPLPTQYGECAAAQRDRLSAAALDEQLSYWTQQLRDEMPVLALPVDRPNSGRVTYQRAACSRRVSVELVEQLRRLSERSSVPLYTTVLAAFQTLLYRYSGEQDLWIGFPVANRRRPEEQSLIGPFGNVLVLRTSLAGEPGIRELLARVDGVAVEAQAHSDLPWQRLAKELRAGSNSSPLFQAMFAFRRATAIQVQGGVTFCPQELHGSGEHPDVALTGLEDHDELELAFAYNPDVYERATVERMLGHLEVLLTGMVTDPEQSIGTLPLLTERERRQLVVEWNDTSAEFPRDQCVHQLIEQQVERTPDRVAVQFGNTRLTYGELNARANQLAHHLRRLGVGPDVLVGISLERSLDLVVGLLGILKAGGAYVPLDPAYPTSRLEFMLRDAQVAVLVTQADVLVRLPSIQAVVVCLDKEREHLCQQSAERLESGVTTDNLAYVIYTSGSTGTPKGTLVRHMGVVNYMAWCQRAYPLDLGRGAPVHSSISFDLTITGLFAPLTQGGTVTLVPESAGVEGLGALLRTEGDFSLIKITPAHLELLSHQLDAAQLAGRTRAFVIGGENLMAETLAAWERHAPETILFNEYGPTETVVGCCVYRIPHGRLIGGIVPIGRPIINTTLYVLDMHLQPVPIGVAGELYIGGVGVARGYLNRPDLTQERFIADPFGRDPGARLYRTGDVARYRPDGNLECLGRTDDQVKLRGYRIELGEIVAAILAYPSVRDAAAIVREDTPGNKRLVAYVVAKLGSGTELDELRAFLVDRLPEYMVPAVLVPMDALPLTSSGKMDRRALPDPNAVRGGAPGRDDGPRTPVQAMLESIWCQVLGLERVGLHDDFLELGSHSLSVMQVASRVRDQLGVDVPQSILFKARTIAQWSAAIEAIKNSGVRQDQSRIVPVARHKSPSASDTSEKGS